MVHHEKLSRSGTVVVLAATFLLSALPVLRARPMAAEPKGKSTRPPDREIAESPTVSQGLREAPDKFVFEEKPYRTEFLDEGWLLRFKPHGGFVAFWVMEIRGSRGQIVWTRERGSLSFGMEDGFVQYHRTPLIKERYAVNRYGIRQIWRFDGNPLWEGGDLIIVGEILTPLRVRLWEGRIHFFDGEKWIGAFCSFEAEDDAGRVIDLVPELDQKVVTLTVPREWIYRIGRPVPRDR